MSAILHDIGTFLLVGSAVGSLGFCGLYHFSSFWWKDTTGQHLMAFTGSCAVILTMSAIRALFGDSTWFEALRLAMFASYPVVLTWRYIMLWRYNIKPKGRLRRTRRWQQTQSSSRQTRMSQYLHHPQEEPPTPDSPES